MTDTKEKNGIKNSFIMYFAYIFIFAFKGIKFKSKSYIAPTPLG